jgi:hypothetical protein
MDSLAFAIVVVKYFMSRTLSNRTPVSRHMAKSTSGSMLQQLWMPLIGQSSATGNRDGPDCGGQSGGPSDSSGYHKDDKKPRDSGKKKGGGSKKDGSNPQGGGSTGSGGTMMAMAVHEKGAKVCTV